MEEKRFNKTLFLDLKEKAKFFFEKAKKNEVLDDDIGNFIGSLKLFFDTIENFCVDFIELYHVKNENYFILKIDLEDETLRKEDLNFLNKILGELNFVLKTISARAVKDDIRNISCVSYIVLEYKLE